MFVVSSAWHQLCIKNYGERWKKKKNSAEKTKNFCASNVRYIGNFNIEKMDPLLILRVDDLNQKEIPLTQCAIAAKARSIFDEIQQKEGGYGTFSASERRFEFSSNACTLIA